MVTTTTGLATSFIQFTRTSNATVTDRDGKIKWAGHNLLTNSESFDASSWDIKSQLNAIGANASSAPNGTSTADKIIPNTVSNAHYIAQTIAKSTVSTRFVFSVFVKADGYSYGNVGFSGASISNQVAASFDLVSVPPIITAATIAGTGFTAHSSAISAVGSGWFLVTIEGTTDTSAEVKPFLRVDSVYNTPTYSGNGTSGMLLWGAHLYRSDLGSMQANASAYPMYNPSTPRNLLGFTEDFSNAAWDKSFFGTSATSNTLIAPNGLQTADLITAINSTNDHVVYQSSGINLAASGVVTGSIYVKANTATFVRCGVVDNASGTDWAGFIVNLSTGAVTNTYTGANASNVTTHTPVSVGNGWYRVGITATLTASANNLSLRVGPFNAASASPGNYFSVSWAAAGTESIYLWGAQLSDSASLDAYSPVYGAAVTSAAYYAPRLDFDPVTLAARGLLVEEQRTNLFQRSEELNLSPWVAIDCPVTADQTTAPSGVSTADRMLPNTANSQHYVYQSATLVSGQTYTFSVYAKPDGYKRLLLRENSFSGKSVAFDVSTGAVVGTDGATGQITPVGNGWYRCEMTFSAISSASTVLAIIVLPDTGTSWANASFAANGTSAIFAWGAQLDSVTGGNAPFATSYIPTGASTATRTADVASVSTQAFPYSSTEGTVVVSGDVLSVANTNSANLWSFYIDSNNIMRSWIWDGAKTTPRGTVVVAGSTSAEMTNGTVTANTPFKTGTALKQNDFAFSLNGASPATDPSGPVIAATNALWLGSLGGTAASSLNGHIRQITYIPRRLSNSELQARTV